MSVTSDISVVQYVYKRVAEIELKIAVYHPPDWKIEDSRTAIVFFGGGAWRVQNPEQFRPQSTFLANEGFVAATAEYRTRNQHGTTPVQAIADAKSAVRWIRSNATRLGVDPSMITASGGSAGGHIAACAATIQGFEEEGENLSVSSVPDALVLFNPVLDPSSLTKLLGRPEFSEMGCSREDISPLLHVKPGLPPTLIFHGTVDEVVPYSQAVRFKERMDAAGNECTLVPAPGQGHGFFNYHRSEEWYRRCIEMTRDFLVSLQTRVP